MRQFDQLHQMDLVDRDPANRIASPGAARFKKQLSQADPSAAVSAYGFWDQVRGQFYRSRSQQALLQVSVY